MVRSELQCEFNLMYRELFEQRSTFGFRQDNPAARGEKFGDEWLAHNREAAGEETGDWSIRGRALGGALTATMGQRKPMFLSPRLLSVIDGVRGENRIPGEPQFDRLLARVQENGWDYSLPHNEVLVGVNHHGNAYVIEGNTRIAVAKRLGIPWIQVEFRWFNGAEEVDGMWHPETVAELAATTPEGGLPGV
jgi:hypothetical protein